MTAVSPQSVDVDEQRAELKSVLDSAQFTRAPKLAQLLSYLCEKLFAGESNHIKEYSIGLEVFQRGASFDQNSDSIVRVEANRLRKRLADFYAGEGAFHRLHIIIPVGQYVPEFEPATRTRREADQPEQRPLPHAELEVSSNAPEVVRSRAARLMGVFGAGVVVMAALALIVAYVWSINHRPKASAVTPPPEPAIAVPAETQFGPPIGEEVRILAGASRSFVDHAGKLWGADMWSTGGSAIKSPVQHFWRTLDPDFYRSSRQGDFRYDIPLKKGIYEVRLHFAETTFGPESTGTGGEGNRLMSVRANGAPLLTHFDIAADAGASRTADVKVFINLRATGHGMESFTWNSQAMKGRQALLSAIEILPGARRTDAACVYSGAAKPVLLQRQRVVEPGQLLRGRTDLKLHNARQRDRRSRTLSDRTVGQLLVCYSRIAREIFGVVAFFGAPRRRRILTAGARRRFAGSDFQCVLQRPGDTRELQPAA